MNNAPERIWAHCFNTPEHGGWDQWGGYARPNNRHPLDEKEIATGAEYIRLDLHEAEVARLRADLRHVIDERDRTFALMLARAEKAEAERDRLRAALDDALVACRIVDAVARAGHEKIGDLVLHMLSAVEPARAALKGDSDE